MSLRLALLGPPVVEVDGRAVTFDTRKAVALLAYLGVTGHPHRRDALAALCWPDADRERAGAALRRTLSVLRAGIGAERLAVDRASVALADGAAHVDVVVAEALAARCGDHGHPPAQACAGCVAPLQEAAALHRGVFLEGFGLRDSPAFDDWQFFTAEEQTRQLADVLDRLARARVAAGDLPGAIAAARRRLALDPLHEPAHRALMRLFAWDGHRAAALRQYRECVRVLDAELGVPPLAETTALYQRILEQRLAPPRPPQQPAAPPARPHVPATAAPSATPLAGRDADLAVVRAALRRSGPDGVLVAVEGEAGIGKTRLAAEALASAGTGGRRVLTARGFPGERGLAYGVVLQLLRAALPAADWAGVVAPATLAETARLLPELGKDLPPPPPPLDAAAARSRFVDALDRTLVAAAGDHGVLVVDDLQWADDASVEVVDHLARRLRRRPVAVLLAWRGDELPRGHRLPRLVADLRRDGLAEQVSLSRLSRDDVRALVAVAVPSAVSAAEQLHAVSEGLPLLVGAYLPALAAGGTVPDEPPGDVRAVLQTRLEAVSPAAEQLLAGAAVLGRTFDPDALREASGRSEEEVAAGLDELLERGLVRALPGVGAYDFTHEMLRSLAYEGVGLARRRLLHRRAADALERRARRRHDEAAQAGVIASHWRQAGQDERAATWAARAGDHAAGLLAVGEAAGHYRQALALGHPDIAGLQEVLGDLATLAGRYGEAVTAYETAAASTDPAHLPRLERKLGGVHHRLGDWQLAEHHLAAALAGLTGPDAGGERARVLADRGLNAHRRGDQAAALRLASAARAAAESAGDRVALAQASNLLGLLARAHGDLEAAGRWLRDSLRLARALGQPAAEVAALNNLALVHSAAGDHAQAEAAAQAALAKAAAVGDRHRQAALHNNLADLLHAAGRHDEAMTHLKRAVAIFADVGRPGVLSPEVWKLVSW